MTNRPRSLAVTTIMGLVALLVPLSGPASAAALPSIDVEPETQLRNQDDTVTLTASTPNAAPQDMNVDWENEGGPNDGDASTSREAIDDECTIFAGTLSCSITYTAEELGTDTWRAWVDMDHSLDEDFSDTTDDSDRTEGRNEQATPGMQPPGNPLADSCQTTGDDEPDCTDVVAVTTEGMEVAPDVQTLDAGQTARLTARLATTAQRETNVDFEAETSSSFGDNDPDRSTTPRTPDATCTIPEGVRECFVEYQGLGGSDQWRAWIDEDNAQATVEADSNEGRWAGNRDCQQPEDTAACTPGFPANQNPGPGNGCSFSPEQGDTPNRTEPDCTDVVSLSFRGGPAATVDCDDNSGDQTQDTERETNPSRPTDGSEDVDDPSTERYQCRVRSQTGGGVNNVEVKMEIENGINDPDPQDGASYDSPDDHCITEHDPDDPSTLIFANPGFCYIEVPQEEGELGLAEICFWVGTAAEGATLCADEPTGENQQANGTDPPNDFADQVDLTWENASTFALNCEPETDANPAGTEHTVTCTATSPSGATVGDVLVEAEITGAGDPDLSNSAASPDAECTTGPDGTCSYTHSSSAEGLTTYRSWIDDGKAEPAQPAGDQDADLTEARDEATTPGRGPEPDGTDVTEKEWGAEPGTVAMTPETDSAPVGECNPYSITVTDAEGNAVPNATLDIEQRHELADNQAANDEPSVSFCEPPSSAGPNPSNVDESQGDSGGPGESENPDNEGTAGGETAKSTDQNGRITIGIRVAPGNGSNGSGGVTVTAWFETDDNDDPGTDEHKDSSTKAWTPGPGEPGVPAGLSLQPTSSRNEPGKEVTYKATVSDVNGDPVEGATVSWTEDGDGDFVSQESETDSNGEARAVVTSDRVGTQTISASADDCAQGATCSDSSTQEWAEAFCPGHRNDPRNQIVGTRRANTIRGTSRADVICSGGGADKVSGRGGNDLILGGGGNDNLSGNGGNDRVKGGAGNDTISGNGGDDSLSGGGGRDRLSGGAGNDRLVGGSGTDRCGGGDGRDRLRQCE